MHSFITLSDATSYDKSDLQYLGKETVQQAWTLLIKNCIKLVLLRKTWYDLVLVDFHLKEITN